MQTEETKGNGPKVRCDDFKICNPENFKKMFAKMTACCPCQDESAADFATTMNGMMKTMMEMCYGPKQKASKEGNNS